MVVIGRPNIAVPEVGLLVVGLSGFEHFPGAGLRESAADSRRVFPRS
jgi:hypothetical protein